MVRGEFFEEVMFKLNFNEEEELVGDRYGEYRRRKSKSKDFWVGKSLVFLRKIC